MTDTASKVRIENIEDLTKILNNRTIQDQDILTEIRVGFVSTQKDIINLSTMLEELRSQVESHMIEQDQLWKEHMEIMRQQKAEIEDVKHNCRKVEDWKRSWDRLEKLEKAETMRSGGKKWEDRVWNVLQAIIIAVSVAVVLFFMKGGAIS